MLYYPHTEWPQCAVWQREPPDRQRFSAARRYTRAPGWFRCYRLFTRCALNTAAQVPRVAALTVSPQLVSFSARTSNATTRRRFTTSSPSARNTWACLTSRSAARSTCSASSRAAQREVACTASGCRRTSFLCVCPAHNLILTLAEMAALHRRSTSAIQTASRSTSSGTTSCRTSTTNLPRPPLPLPPT